MTWRAHIEDRPEFFARRRVRLVIYRPLGDTGTEFVLQDGRTSIAPPTVAVSLDNAETPIGFEIPDDSLAALRDAIDAKLGRHYDEALVFELRQTLERERTRHDDLVDRIAGAALDTHTTELAIGHLGRVARPGAPEAVAGRPVDYTEEEPF